jgi:hypothetical protein
VDFSATAEAFTRRTMNVTPWKLHPLYYGEFLAFERSRFVLYKGEGEMIKAPCIGWLIENGDEKILVDTGPGDPATVKKYHHYHYGMNETDPTP